LHPQQQPRAQLARRLLRSTIIFTTKLEQTPPVQFAKRVIESVETAAIAPSTKSAKRGRDSWSKVTERVSGRGGSHLRQRGVQAVRFRCKFRTTDLITICRDFRGVGAELSTVARRARRCDHGSARGVADGREIRNESRTPLAKRHRDTVRRTRLVMMRAHTAFGH